MKKTFLSPGGKVIKASQYFHEIIFDCHEGHSLPLITYNEEKSEFEVNVDAMEEIEKYDGNVGFVSIAGLKETGKSFLLNHLLCL